MDDELDRPRVQADNQSIAIGEINISSNVTGTIKIGHTIIQAADARLRRDLGILLKNVETTWIKGVLEKSVHEAALLELGMEIRAEAVDNPWRMVIEKPDQSQEIIQQGRKIKDIFDEANRLLLILGEPGSGKTTTLLQLARDLIAEVHEAFTQPVPVILNLSTWTDKQQPLDKWLIAELSSKYRVPKKDGQRWLSEHRILPLLDGLDEVKVENRAACVEQINQLVTGYGLQGLVVCSRIKDYTDLNVRLAFYRAIYIQPLTSEQVDEYLRQAGNKLASLRTILQDDDALRSMAQSPLILNIMGLAYQNMSAEALSDPSFSTDKVRRKHLFDAYISRMFNRKVGLWSYDDKQTKQRLSWLARNMQHHNQEVFLIEGLQPSWLLARGWQWVYTLTSRLIEGLIIGAVFPGFLVPFLSLSFLGDLTGMTFIGPLIIIIGPVIGLCLGFIDVLRFEYHQKQTRLGKSSTIWWPVANIIVVGLIDWIIIGLMTMLIFGLKSSLFYGLISWEGEWLSFGMIAELINVLPQNSIFWEEALFIGVSLGLGFATIFGLIFGLRGSRQYLYQDIQTVEALHWSGRRVVRGGMFGVSGGLILGLIFELLIFLDDRLLGGVVWGGFVELLSVELWFGFLGGLVGAIFNGLNGEIIETRTTSNQGIYLSIRNAILVGLVVGLLGASIVLLLHGGLGWGLVVGLIFGLLAALWYGGLDVIQHYALRFIIIVQGHTPANYARFLDYAADRIFLQKVGGGYRFIHRLLLEHFAEIDTTTKKV